jgi:hypothetical protein
MALSVSWSARTRYGMKDMTKPIEKEKAGVLAALTCNRV